MNRIVTKTFLTFSLFFIVSCAISTVNKAIKNGANRLTVEEIYALVSNNTLHLESSNFDAQIFYAKDGFLASNSQAGTQDSGYWDIKSDSTLCIQFRTWYFGDFNCYSIYQEPGQDDYLLFTENGALAYTATFRAGNPKGLEIMQENREKENFVRSALSAGQKSGSPETQAATSTPTTPSPPAIESIGPAATREEIKTTVENMAQNCPGCNLKDADLRKANLIGANLKGANLQGADLSRANLRRANLEGADLSGATLLSTNLPGANLKNTDLSGADLTGSNLIRADLSGATLTNSILTNTLQEGSTGLQGANTK